MQDVSIEIQLANRKYPLKVKSAEANSVQKAATLINQKLSELETKYGVKDIQDLFAMSALQITTQLIELESNNTGNQDQVFFRLEEMDQLITSILDEK
ncbi:MAG TPA: cell division protein ZapA [Flavobacteriales bacterium]|jgi:cell division protein ZapA (FtsZ GTPase activity inhibitor)|nr:cell division protein ZapA [Flavobacteriales bacterium]HPH81090.1 cell division protein ZapA [Flavobacteriales bacterium]